MEGSGVFCENRPGTGTHQVNRKNPYHKQKGIRVNQCHKLGSNSGEQHTSDEKFSQSAMTLGAFFQNENQKAAKQSYRAAQNVKKEEEVEEKFTHGLQIKIRFTEDNVDQPGKPNFQAKPQFLPLKKPVGFGNRKPGWKGNLN